MKENNNFIKLILLLILRWKIKMTNIRGINKKLT